METLNTTLLLIWLFIGVWNIPDVFAEKSL